MDRTRMRKRIPKTAAFVYAGYKWLEDHTDEVERWSAKAMEHARGKRYEKIVNPAATAARTAARFVRDNHGRDEKKSLRRSPR
jgi:hypothetical protein